MSRKMSRYYDCGSDDYPTAVAAAAYAVQIQSPGGSKVGDQDAKIYGPLKSLNMNKSKVDGNKEAQPGQLKSAHKLSDETSSLEESAIKMPEKAKDHSSYENTMNDEKGPETPLLKPAGPGDSMADAWEKEEMAIIKERYERLTATIDKWEVEKKKKLNLKYERKKANPDKKRAKKAEQSHDNEIKKIEKIAGEAKAKAEAKHKKEELKVKKKANKIRLTGKLPATCLCC